MNSIPLNMLKEKKASFYFMEQSTFPRYDDPANNGGQIKYFVHNEIDEIFNDLLKLMIGEQFYLALREENGQCVGNITGLGVKFTSSSSSSTPCSPPCSPPIPLDKRLISIEYIPPDSTTIARPTPQLNRTSGLMPIEEASPSPNTVTTSQATNTAVFTFWVGCDESKFEEVVAKIDKFAKENSEAMRRVNPEPKPRSTKKALAKTIQTVRTKSRQTYNK